jgi:type II secretion system protein J
MRYPLAKSKNYRGFTLIEILISTALMSLVLGSAYMCLNAGSSSQMMINRRADVMQNGRVALARISADLRSACPLSKRYEFLGMHRDLGEIPSDNLDFGTHNYAPARQNEGDFCETSYFLRDNFLRDNEENHTYSLWRRRDPTPDDDPLNGGTEEEIARGVLGVRFEFYDGFDWFEEWGDPTGKRQTSNREQPNLYGLPEAVRITLLMDPEYSRKKQAAATNGPPLVFQTTARLNLAPKSQQTGNSPAAPDQSPSPAGVEGLPGLLQ